MGSLEHALSSLTVHGSVEADGESFRDSGIHVSNGGPGGGSGGSILLFLSYLTLAEGSALSSAGGIGSRYGGGGGGGGRIHLHWSGIPTGDEYLPVASVKGRISARYMTCILLLLYLFEFIFETVEAESKYKICHILV